MKNSCRVLIVFIVFTIFLCFVFGCGNNLTREKAFEMIDKNFPDLNTAKFYLVKNYIFDKNILLIMQQLASKGVIDIKETYRTGGYGGTVIGYTTYLTDLGRTYTIEISKDHSYAIVIIGKRKLVKIKGMKFSNENKRAEVEFLWETVDLTPFGEFAKNFNVQFIKLETDFRPYETFYPGTAIISLYDDGWRIEKNSIKVTDGGT